jgi:hypothetical protein
MKITKGSLAVAGSLICIFATGFMVRGVFSAGTVSLVPSARAQDKDKGPGSHKCSDRTLKGSFGIKFEGTKLGFGPLVSVSRITFDGEGQFTTNEIGRFNGALIQRTFTGPYTVNDDCTGFLDFSSNLTNPPHVAHGDFVIVDEGQEFFVLDNEDGWAATGVGKRL